MTGTAAAEGAAATTALRALAHTPTLNQVILKVAQRCNLDCTYCYVYNRGDDSWRTRPTYVQERVVEALGQRIREHCQKYELTSFGVELHGGEPLLLGRARMQRVLDGLTSRCPDIHIRFVLQTNGLLLDEAWLDLFQHNSLGFGISLDGPPESADRRRVKRSGGGSTQELLDIISRLRAQGPRFDSLFGGCLCVIDPDQDGGALVQWFADNGFRVVDFLLPDGNRVNLPQDWRGAAPYERFLLEAFDQWSCMGEEAPTIRLFELMMLGRMGHKAPLDALGGDLRQLCVVESDGSIGVNDVARICGGEYAIDVLNVFDDPLDRHAVRYDLARIQRVCEQCRGCPHLASCGGGYLPHRFDGEGFDNPSLYCSALYALSERILGLLRAELPAAAWVPDARRPLEPPEEGA